MEFDFIISFSYYQEANIQNIPQTSPKVVPIPMSVHYSAAVQRALNFTQASIVTQASSTTGKGIRYVIKYEKDNLYFVYLDVFTFTFYSG